MSDVILRREDIEKVVRDLLIKYNAESALLFGSYARGEATGKSDVDIIVFGGGLFKPTDIFSFMQELSECLGKSVDAYEISEVNEGTPFYDSVMREGVKIAA